MGNLGNPYKYCFVIHSRSIRIWDIKIAFQWISNKRISYLTILLPWSRGMPRNLRQNYSYICTWIYLHVLMGNSSGHGVLYLHVLKGNSIVYGTLYLHVFKGNSNVHCVLYLHVLKGNSIVFGTLYLNVLGQLNCTRCTVSQRLKGQLNCTRCTLSPRLMGNSSVHGVLYLH